MLISQSQRLFLYILYTQNGKIKESLNRYTATQSIREPQYMLDDTERNKSWLLYTDGRWLSKCSNVTRKAKSVVPNSDSANRIAVMKDVVHFGHDTCVFQ